MHDAALAFTVQYKSTAERTSIVLRKKEKL